MELRVTLGPNNSLRLILPTGRPLDVGNTEASLRFIQRILMGAKNKPRRGQEQPGHIAEFPTQHVIDIWKREDAKQQVEADKGRFKDMGINLETLDISL